MTATGVPTTTQAFNRLRRSLQLLGLRGSRFRGPLYTCRPPTHALQQVDGVVVLRNTQRPCRASQNAALLQQPRVNVEDENELVVQWEAKAVHNCCSGYSVSTSKSILHRVAAILLLLLP